MKNNNMIIAIVAIIVVGAAAFFGGMQYQKSQTSGTGQFATNGQNAGGRFGGRTGGNGRGAFGSVVSMDATSLTIKLQDGSSKIVNLTSSTKYSMTVTGSASDVKIGTNVAAIGTTNSDGSVTATTIQINPMFGGGRPSPTQ